MILSSKRGVSRGFVEVFGTLSRLGQVGAVSLVSPASQRARGREAGRQVTSGHSTFVIHPHTLDNGGPM